MPSMTWLRTRIVSVRPARPLPSRGLKGDRFRREHAGLPPQPLSRNIGQ